MELTLKTIGDRLYTLVNGNHDGDSEWSHVVRLVHDANSVLEVSWAGLLRARTHNMLSLSPLLVDSREDTLAPTQQNALIPALGHSHSHADVYGVPSNRPSWACSPAVCDALSRHAAATQIVLERPGLLGTEAGARTQLLAQLHALFDLLLHGMKCAAAYEASLPYVSRPT